MVHTLVVALALAAAAEALSPIALPGADGPVGFDDLRFSTELRRVVVPAGRTGRVVLVDPEDHATEAIAGFSSSRRAGRGHGESTTSADTGEGLVFASDRTRQELVVADPKAKKIVTRVKLGGGPDYVRWVAPLREVWVTEPGKKVVETFRLEGGAAPKLTRTGTIAVPDGPESLEIDAGRRRAYANTWHDVTMEIDLQSRKVSAQWKNGCGGARGLALDPRRGFVFVGCDEGKAVALDAGHDGKVVGEARSGNGVDVIAYAADLSHLYVPGADAADLTIVGVASDGALTVLGKFPTAHEAHCVTADDRKNAYVCDPEHGRLLALRDPFPASGGDHGAAPKP
jgi:hypothetical protein